MVEAEARGKKRDFLRRIRVADEAISDDPRDAQALQKRGEAKRKLGLNQEAIGDFDAALKADPRFVLALAGRASAKKAMGLHHEAVVDFDAALEMEPLNALVLAGRGAARRKLGRMNDAMTDVSQAIACGLQSAFVFQLRGEIQRKLGFYEKAVTDFNMALASQPHCVPALAGRGSAKRALGIHKDAIADFNAAIALDPKNASVIAGRGISLQAIGREQDAIRAFNEALKYDPSNSYAMWGLKATQFAGPLLPRIVTLNGFSSSVLNTEYVERRDFLYRVNDLETFWSNDNEYFLYWCKKERRWKGAPASSLQKNQGGSSSAIIGGPVGADILSIGTKGWHEWSGSSNQWVKQMDAVVSNISPAEAASRVVTLDGFTAACLNVRFSERRNLEHIINGHETFWSVDGEYFLFWCKKESRWKLAKSDDLERNRTGGSAAVAAAPACEDLLKPTLLKGWHEWDGKAWVKLAASGVAQLGASKKA